VKDGRFQPGRGSLGEVLPSSVQDLFGEAFAGIPSVSWAPSRSTHVIRVCPPASAPGRVDHALTGASHQDLRRDFSVLEDRFVPRVAASVPPDGVRSQVASQWGDPRPSDRLIGLLVHRLLQREGLATDATDERLREAAVSMLGTLPSTDVDDLTAPVEEAIARFRALSAQQGLRELYQSGRAFHEVPFTMAVDGRILRGTIDCLVEIAPDRVAVLEFKTGRRRVEHQAQADVYRLAAEGLFPGASVDARLVYTSDSERP